MFTVKKEEHNCGVAGTHSNKGKMAAAGGGTPPTIESSENRTGADANASGSLPAGGQDMGATADAGGRNKTKGAQVARKGACGYLYIIIHTENSYMYLS